MGSTTAPSRRTSARCWTSGRALGAWTQWWIAARALGELLSRLDRHAEAGVLLGPLAASSAAPPLFGPDLARIRAVEAAARTALGAQFEVQEALGASLDQAEAVALTYRLTRRAAGQGSP